MNCFGLDEKTGEFIFASAWTDVTKVDSNHRNIVLDAEAEAWVNDRGIKCNDNAVDIAKQMGSTLADEKIGEQMRGLIAAGWWYVDTPTNIRNEYKSNTHTGYALYGTSYGVLSGYANHHNDNGSFRVARRVKKV